MRGYIINYHLFTETEENSVFCGPETSRGATKRVHCFPEVSVNKCFVI